MINSKKEMKYYILCDSKACRRNTVKPRFFGDEIWKFQISLRKLEFFCRPSRSNLNKLIELPARCWYELIFHYWSIRLGFTIPLNVFEEGLSIAHRGCLVVNGNAKVGKNCRIHEGVNIGASKGTSDAPIIGNNVFIAIGAKVLGGIHIADNVAIGANAVVVRDITEPGTTWAGVPAKKVSNNSSKPYLSPFIVDISNASDITVLLDSD